MTLHGVTKVYNNSQGIHYYITIYITIFGIIKKFPKLDQSAPGGRSEVLPHADIYSIMLPYVP